MSSVSSKISHWESTYELVVAKWVERQTKNVIWIFLQRLTTTLRPAADWGPGDSALTEATLTQMKLQGEQNFNKDELESLA